MYARNLLSYVRNLLSYVVAPMSSSPFDGVERAPWRLHAGPPHSPPPSTPGWMIVPLVFGASKGLVVLYSLNVLSAAVGGARIFQTPVPFSWLRIRFRGASWACWPGLQPRSSARRRRQSRSAQAQNHDSSIRLHNECACAQAGRQVTPMCGVNARFHAGGERLTVGLDTFAKEGNVGSASRTCRERSVMRSIRRGGG